MAVSKSDKTRMAARVRALEDQTKALKDQRHTGARPAALVAGQRTGTPHAPGEAARVRRGESVLSSRGFQYLRMMGVASGRFDADHAKVELDFVGRMTKSFAAAGVHPSSANSYWVPFSMAHIDERLLPHELRNEGHLLIKAGAYGADPNEMHWLATKAVTGGMSYQTATDGGALVGPPEFGDLIELWRNKAAVMEAGASTVPLGPTGSTQYPRQVGTTLGYWVGENTDITKSFPETGQFTLRAKKCGCFIVMPNDLLRYSSVAAEALVRTDATKTLALTADFAYMVGEGGNLKPEGIVNTSGVATVTPTTVASDGNTLSPQDIYKFFEEVEENNAEVEAIVMRPRLFYQFVEGRAGVYNGSGVVANGQFVFAQFRQLGDKTVKEIGGVKCVTSNNVPKNRVKGNGTTLTLAIAGQWSDYVVGVFGALEFMQTDQGVQLMQADQTAIRALMITDGGARHPGAFAVCDNLLTAVGA